MSDSVMEMPRVARLEHRCLDMLSAGRSLEVILETITRGVDEIMPEFKSSVLLIEDGKLRHGAAPGLDEEFNRLVDGIEIGEGVGSCGTAAVRGEQVIVTDVADDPLWVDYRDAARQFGLGACWSTPVVDHDGEVLATFAMYSDQPRKPRQRELKLIDRIAQFVRLAIERSRMMEQLKESERRFQMLAEHVQDVFWITSPDKEKVYYVSPAYERIWGRSYEGLTESPRQWLEAIHEEDRQRVRQAAERQREGAYVQEYRVVRPDGDIRWIIDRGFPVYDPDGEVARIVGTARDITSRKTAELKLRERLKELRCLYESSSVLVGGPSHSLEGVCQKIAEVLPSGFQYADVAVARLELEDCCVCTAGSVDCVHRLREDIVCGGEKVGYVEVGYTEECPDNGDGEGPFLPEERKMLEAIAAHISQTIQSRRMERKLARNERLNAIGQLTGGVAHDFNNLLTIIVGNASLLTQQESLDVGEVRELGREILEAGERGAELTRRLLAFARKQPLEQHVTDVNERIESMADLLERTLGEHVQMQLGLAPQLWNVCIDEAQFENSLLNLCINARDAMPEGGQLTVTTANRRIDEDTAEVCEGLEPGNYVCLTVSDTGVGMDERTRQRAFDPFFTTKDMGKGNGLGLSMVYGFVRQSRGQISIDSEPGEGTKIRLFLPAVAEAVDDGASDELAEEPRGAGQKVLVVEDDELVRRNVGRQLELLGYRVSAVGDGPSALKRLEQQDDVDVLFSDVVMPGGMNGYELARAARQMCPELAVVLTSGYSDEVVDARDDGGREELLLAKPYARGELARALQQVIGAGEEPNPATESTS